MNRLKLIGTGVLLLAAIFAFKGNEKHTTLQIGEKAPQIEYKMLNTDNKSTSLDQLKGEKGMLVIFSCNTCPFVIAWEDRYPGLKSLADENQMGFALINSNEAKRQGDDSAENMVLHAKDKGYPDIPYLIDENSKLANAFGAKTTPHVFLFNNKWELVYEGAIDNNYKSAESADSKYLNEAIINLANGNKIDPSNTKAMGCSIKRAS